jgi:hypothetical protein
VIPKLRKIVVLEIALRDEKLEVELYELVAVCQAVALGASGFEVGLDFGHYLKVPAIHAFQLEEPLLKRLVDEVADAN